MLMKIKLNVSELWQNGNTFTKNRNSFDDVSRREGHICGDEKITVNAKSKYFSMLVYNTPSKVFALQSVIM